MSLDNTLRNFDQAFNVLGRTGLNLTFPKEFELYVCALELVTADGETISYFIFPVMPSSIVERMPQVTNIKKTDGGLSVLSTSTYIPTSITLNGNFGRMFRFLLNGQSGAEFVSGFTNKNLFSGGKGISTLSAFQGLKDVFDERVKTGYACTKILEDIVLTSKKLDEKGRGYTLIFHNLAFDRVQIVKVVDFMVSQDQQSNMIWNYNLQMDSLGDARNFFVEKTKGMKTLKGSAFSQKAVDNVIDKVTNLFNKTTNNLV